MSSDALAHLQKSLLNTLGRAVKQFAECLAKQAKVSSRTQSTTAMPIPDSCFLVVVWLTKATKG